MKTTPEVELAQCVAEGEGEAVAGGEVKVLGEVAVEAEVEPWPEAGAEAAWGAEAEAEAEADMVVLMAAYIMMTVLRPLLFPIQSLCTVKHKMFKLQSTRQPLLFNREEVFKFLRLHGCGEQLFEKELTVGA
eukprot:1737245-Rhodomonas_salina.1